MSHRLKRVLLVEDDPRDSELTLSALNENNLANEVTVLRDGVAAWEHLCAQAEQANHSDILPAVVLLDLKMPKMDGLEVLKRMRGHERLRAIPVVMLTSSREERDLVESYRLGVNAYVVKPVAFEDFMAAVRNLGLFWAVINEPPPGCVRRAA
jgi:CheY-like chemotaxis protein